MVCKLPVIQSRKLHRTPTLVHNLVLAGTFSIYHIVNGTLFRFNIQGQSLNLVLFMSQSCICFLCFCFQLLDRNLSTCVLYVCNCLYFLFLSCLLCCSGCLCGCLCSSLCSCFRSEAYVIPSSFAISCIVFNFLSHFSLPFCPILSAKSHADFVPTAVIFLSQSCS